MQAAWQGMNGSLCLRHAQDRVHAILMHPPFLSPSRHQHPSHCVHCRLCPAAARYSMYATPTTGARGHKAVPTATPPAARITTHHFQLLAQQALAPAATSTSFQQHTTADPPSSSRLPSTGQVSAAGQDRQQREDPLWQLPRDVAPKVAEARARAAEAHAAAQEAAERVQLLRVGSLPHLHVTAPSGSSSSSRPQQQADLELAPGAVDAAQETARLLDTVLGVARGLARTRAANKQALQATLKGLPDTYLLINT